MSIRNTTGHLHPWYVSLNCVSRKRYLFVHWKCCFVAARCPANHLIPMEQREHWKHLPDYQRRNGRYLFKFNERQWVYFARHDTGQCEWNRPIDKPIPSTYELHKQLISRFKSIQCSIARCDNQSGMEFLQRNPIKWKHGSNDLFYLGMDSRLNRSHGKW